MSAAGPWSETESSSRGTPPRILVVGPVPPPSHGVTVMTAAVLDVVRNARWRVVHVDTSDHRDIGNIGKLDLGNVILAFGHIGRFACTLLGARPDVVYVPLSQGVAGFLRDGVFLLLSRLSPASVVVHAHGAQYGEFYRRMPRAVRRIMRLCLARVGSIIVLAEAQRCQFNGWASRRARVEVIPNGVRDEWPDGPPQRQPSEGGTVLFLGNLLRQKGFLDVLDAIPMVLRSVPGARFMFAGEPARDEATAAFVGAQVREPGVGDAITVAGVVGPSKRHSLLETADIFAFPPRWDEGQPLVALEVMSAGLPLVVTSSGGLTETVRDGVDAIIVPKHDPEAIAAAITRLLKDPALRAAMGAAGRERYEAEYTIDRWGSRMLEAFEVALEMR